MWLFESFIQLYYNCPYTKRPYTKGRWLNFQTLSQTSEIHFFLYYLRSKLLLFEVILFIALRIIVHLVNLFVPNLLKQKLTGNYEVEAR